ncbi:hypothetical protein LX15_003536 [Streptoalloteichus tenebrarius]|uniref:Uncharacterized protein n=1 Tax=Streptoalloteichus tenebrarius (strain ATCC 17920 / DSM 40477 / JCM 4838 / CBS 697.72 / NBRC 16177 / NCIMB 11028 / NRRL B-12390 / A12253. 1 / ISP 5477) TaxID=1933 RepID=A0ABT1HWD4_STRSD|nr:hypothetical protein [Streptoalloteichus tenebrarius]MCP2259827.1 hypothetical protein [Streptoalloteichus tenebrarius]BFE99223.1 hypothetical protein GCM10020241_08990 [Streptoalloteichus tenebrarius]
MKIEVSTEPHLADALEEELWAAAFPEGTEDALHEDDLVEGTAGIAGIAGAVGAACDLASRPRVLATAVARRDGVLLGWAELHAPRGRQPRPTLTWRLAAREINEIRGCLAGEDVERDSTEDSAEGTEEFALVRALVDRLVAHARESGCDGVAWDASEVHADRLAETHGAVPGVEHSRYWGATPLDDWTPPHDLPVVRARHMPDPAPYADYAALYRAGSVHGRPQWTEEDVRRQLDLDLDLPPELDAESVVLDVLDESGRPLIQFPAIVADGYASVGYVAHHRPHPDVLAAGIVSLISTLRARETPVSTLAIREEDDPVLASAAERAGLRVVHRDIDHHLDLARE